MLFIAPKSNSLLSTISFGYCCQRLTRKSRFYNRLARTSGVPRLETSSSREDGSACDDQVTTRSKHTVYWKNAGRDILKFHAFDGELLRTAALRRGLVSPHNGNAKLINCRGLGTCGTCAVEIEESSEAIDPPERNRVENLRLSFPPHTSPDQSPLLRLACQVQVKGDINVTKRNGFWGQGKELGKSGEDCQTYVGDLEYLLDSKSPLAEVDD